MLGSGLLNVFQLEAAGVFCIRVRNGFQARDWQKSFGFQFWGRKDVFTNYVEAVLERSVGCVLRIENLPRTAIVLAFANGFRGNNKAAEFGNALETFRKLTLRMFRDTNLLS